jgi:hypothetical protein
MKFCLETEPVLLGSSVEKTALAPIDLKPAGGLRVLKACVNWFWLIEPDFVASIWLNKLDIFCDGAARALAPDIACGA